MTVGLQHGYVESERVGEHQWIEDFCDEGGQAAVMDVGAMSLVLADFRCTTLETPLRRQGRKEILGDAIYEEYTGM
ncbi:uncharacterized protein ARMOST_01549 [Armillaria ostoyae]|uniref:Uncharacterized protein n=1 Tax=Armillaria ostoyae TaxID=47428 RepID=A0A284QPA3_ARMOS|nr:uncharacterized protein ARMOST_01549 [Armillaria ostoyae]